MYDRLANCPGSAYNDNGRFDCPADGMKQPVGGTIAAEIRSRSRKWLNEIGFSVEA